MKRVEAYKDLLVATRKGEKWKDIEGYEGIYQISSHGRIKSLPRYIEIEIPSQRHVIRHTTPERIRKCRVTKKMIHHSKVPYYECVIALKQDKVEKSHLVGRLVYHAFIAKLDFEIDRLMITHKNRDGRDNHVRNLLAATRSDVTKKAYALSRHKSPFALKTEKEMKGIRKKAARSRWKAVQRVSASGRVLQNFPSVRHAMKATGITEMQLIDVLKGRKVQVRGMYWRYK